MSTPQQLSLIEFSPQMREDMDTFLHRWVTIEDEEDRLRQEKADLRKEYGEVLLLRALLVAVKRVRAQRALEAHTKEPMPRQYQAQFEEIVEHFLDQRAADAEAVTQAAEALTQRNNGTTGTRHAVPDMTGPPGA